MQIQAVAQAVPAVAAAVVMAPAVISLRLVQEVLAAAAVALLALQFSPKAEMEALGEAAEVLLERAVVMVLVGTVAMAAAAAVVLVILVVVGLEMGDPAL